MKRIGRSLALPALASALLAVILYAPIIWNDFIYDDLPIIVRDVRLDQPSFGYKLWVEQWWPNGTAIPISRPLTTFTYWLQIQLQGRSPITIGQGPDAGQLNLFHVVDLALFALLCAVMAYLAGRVFIYFRELFLSASSGEKTGLAAAWIVGLLFAAHPIHVEVVAGVVGRAETLSALWIIAGLLLWLRWRSDSFTWRRAALIALAVLFAGLSKESGYLLAPIFGVMEFTLRRAEGRPTFSKPWPWRAVVMIFIVAILAFTQRQAMQYAAERKPGLVGDIDNPLVIATPAERLVTPIKLIGKAAQLLIAPINQSPDYSPRMLMPTTHLSDPLVLAGLAVIACWIGLMIWAWRKRSVALGPLAAMAIVWFIPSNTFLLIGTIFAERLLTPLTVFAPLAILTMFCGSARRSLLLRFASSVIIAIAVIGYSFATLMYLPAWKSQDTLLVYTISYHPTSGRFQGFLASNLLIRGLGWPTQRDYFFDAAQEHARLALKYWPRNDSPYITLGVIAYECGDMARAREYLTYAQHQSLEYSLADVYLQYLDKARATPQLQAEQEKLQAHLTDQPDDLSAQRRLAVVYAQLKEWKKARELFDRIITPDEFDTDVINHYISTLVAGDDTEKALQMYQRWMELQPNQWSLLTDAAMLAIYNHIKLDEARQWLDKAIQLSPGSTEPWAGLCLWYQVQGEHDKAVDAIRQALARSKPDDPRYPHYQQMLENLNKR